MPVNMQGSAVEARMHVDHCIEALRISLMCHGDVTPYLVMYDAASGSGFKADFSPHHRCRRFEPLRAHMEQHAFYAASKPSDGDERP